MSRRPPRLYHCDPAAIKRGREVRGLSQADLAREAGISAVTVNRLESAGPDDTFSLRVLASVAHAFERKAPSAELTAILGSKGC